jgi:hypothetical protein
MHAAVMKLLVEDLSVLFYVSGSQVTNKSWFIDVAVSLVGQLSNSGNSFFAQQFQHTICILSVFGVVYNFYEVDLLCFMVSLLLKSSCLFGTRAPKSSFGSLFG